MLNISEVLYCSQKLNSQFNLSCKMVLYKSIANANLLNKNVGCFNVSRDNIIKQILSNKLRTIQPCFLKPYPVRYTLSNLQHKSISILSKTSGFVPAFTAWRVYKTWLKIKGNSYHTTVLIIVTATVYEVVIYSLPFQKCQNYLHSIMLIGVLGVAENSSQSYDNKGTAMKYLCFTPLLMIHTMNLLCLGCIRWPLNSKASQLNSSRENKFTMNLWITFPLVTSNGWSLGWFFIA